MAFTIQAGNFGDLPVTPEFVPQITFNTRGDGTIQSYTESWPIVGFFVGTAEEQRDFRRKLRDIFIAGVQKFVFKQDGAPFETIQAGEFDASPLVETLNVERGQGNWAIILRYSFAVVAKKPLLIPGVINFNRRFTFEEEKGEKRVIKNVDAEGTGAIAFVESEEPLGTTRSVIEDDTINKTAKGTFTTQEEPLKGSLVWNETIRFSGGLHPVRSLRTVGGNKLIRQFGARLPFIVRVNGTLTSRKRAEVTAEIPPIPGVPDKLMTSRDDGAVRVLESNKDGEPIKFERSYSRSFEVDRLVKRKVFDDRVIQLLGLGSEEQQTEFNATAATASGLIAEGGQAAE